MDSLHDALTQFPNLYSERNRPSVNSNNTLENALASSNVLHGDIEEDALICAWAQLLGAYTSDDHVSFVFNGCIVTVDLAAKPCTIQRNDGATSETPEILGNSTAVIYCQPESTSSLQLEHLARQCSLLLVYHSNGELRLTASSSVPRLHVSQLLLQLLRNVKSADRDNHGPATEESIYPCRLSSINEQPKFLEGPSLLHELAFSRHHHDNIAIDFTESSGVRSRISYAELRIQVSDLTRRIERSLSRLDEEDLQKQQVIPVLVPQSIDLYIALLAILGAGAAFCPLSVDTPTDRQSFILRDISASIIVTTNELSSRVPEEFLGRICPVRGNSEALQEKNSTQLDSKPPRSVQSQDLAYILYTSGSTGLPKGVKLSHAAVTQSLLAHDAEIPRFSRFLQFADPTFDVAMFEIFFTLFRGSTLVGCDKQRLINDLVRVMNELKIDAADLTPTIAGSLLKTRQNVPQLKHLLTIGEMLTNHVVEEFGGSNTTKSMLHGMYGPTEAAIHCTAQVNFPASAKVGLIGTPLETVSIFIARPIEVGDGHGLFEVLPIGHIGELVLGGHQLAGGYLNRSEETKASFINVPNHGTLYRTGDRARILPDGNIECLGRIQSGQIKLRGQRIELGEIEQAALRTPGCSLAVASVIDQNIVLFCQADTSTVNKETVLQICRAWLPSYMIPNDISIFQAMPRLASGKIHRKALESAYREKLENIEERVSDSLTDLEQHVVDAVSSVLGETPTLDMNLFRMGLDSLSAIHLASKLRQDSHRLGIQHYIIAENVLQNPTCRGLASIISNNVSRDTRNAFDFIAFERTHRFKVCSKQKINETSIEKLRPTTAQQNGMLSQSLRSNGDMYFNLIIIPFQKASNRQRLEQAWTKAAKIFEMLRTGFIEGIDTRHPFLMATYRPSTFVLPLLESNRIGSTPSQWNEDRRRIAHECVSNLREPPWRIAILEKHKHIEVALFAHHALYDAESLWIITSTIQALYDDMPLDTPFPIEPALQNILSATEDNDGKHETYWKEHLAGITVTKFPDLAPLRSSERDVFTTKYMSSLAGIDVEKKCQNLAITFQAALQVAWARLLSAYLGESKVTFGLVLSGRDEVDTEKAAFPCTTTVPYYCDTTKDVAEMLNKAMSFGASVRSHQHCSLAHIQRWIGLSSVSLFDTLLVLQLTGSRDGSDSYWRENYSDARVEQPVSLEVCLETDGRVSFQLVAWDDLVPQVQSDLILQQFDSILGSVLNAENEHVSPIPAHLLSHLPPRTSSLPSPISFLHEFVEAVSMEIPDSIAIEYNLLGSEEPTRWTYKELDEEGNRVANLILDQAVKAHSIIATCFEKHPNAYFATLGILKAGCTFLAIDTGAPSARKRFILEDSRSSLVLTDSTHFHDLQRVSSVPVICIDSEARRRYSSLRPETAAQLDRQDSCYCLYTSGSTGTPKGCVLTHENAVQAMLAFQRLYAGTWDSSSRWLQFASFHFDVCVMEQYWSWSVGICVVCTPRDILFEDLPGAIGRLRITHIDLTPSLARLISPQDVPSLCKGVFVTGGEALSQEVIDVWGPENVIHNGYGPTETTIGNIMYTRVPVNGKPLNIGWQFDNVGTYVFEPGTTECVLKGAVGELCIAGPLVAKGYLNKPELTDKSFTFVEKYGQRLYHTKDLVRILHDNSFQFCGRMDDQVKLRGQRLELGEVSNAIRECSDALSEVKALVIESSKTQTQQLVAFASVKSDMKPLNGSLLAPLDHDLVEKMRLSCHHKLPNYMIPAHFVLLKAMPLTGNNKYDTRRLTEALDDFLTSKDSSLLQHHVSTELSKTEKRLATLASTSLNVDVSTISATSNLFQLGLDSISVFGFAQTMRDAGFSAADPVKILHSQSIGNLAKALDSASALENDSLVVSAKQQMAASRHKYLSHTAKVLGIGLIDIEEVAPCTPIQQGIIARSMEGEGGNYFNFFTFDLSSHMELGRLSEAWELMYTKIPALRAKYVPVDEGYVQVFVKQANAPIFHVTNSSGEGEHILTKWRKVDDEVIKDPLCIILEQSVSQSASRMIVGIFHALYDAISLDLIFDYLADAYRGNSINSGPGYIEALPYGPLKIRPDAQQYWKTALADAAYHPLAQNLVGTSVDDSFATLELSNIGSLDGVRKQLGVTNSAILQTCWSTVLQEFVGYPTIIGKVVSGRSIAFPDADRIIGPMFNTIPSWIAIGEDPESWRSLILRCHNSNIASLPYQHTPLRDIIKWLTSSNGSQIFDTLFVFQAAQSSTASQNDLWTKVEQQVNADYPLSFEVNLTSQDQLQLNITAKGSIVSDAQCLKLLRDFEKTLRSVLENSLQLVGNAKTKNVAPTNNNKIRLSRPLLVQPSTAGANFQWSDAALIIRSEIAQLAQTATNVIKPDTSIFEIGIDSIDCIKLSSRLKKKGLRVSVSSILRNTTIRQLVQILDGRDQSVSNDQYDDCYLKMKRDLENYFSMIQSDISYSAQDVEDVFPTTPLQQSMLAAMFESELQNYFNHDILKLHDHVDIIQLQKACQDLIDKSPVLRTSFFNIEEPSLDAIYGQVVHRTSHNLISHLHGTSNSTPDQVIAEITSRAKVAGIDFKPCQFTFFSTRSASYLIITLAHAIYDGWSLNLIHTGISRLYQNIDLVVPHYGPVLRDIINGSNGSTNAFWQGYLADCQPTLFPCNTQTFQPGAYLKERKSSIDLAVIRTFCQNQNITLQALGATCWAFALATYVRQLDITFGIVFAGRDDEAAQQVMFPTMNTLAVRSIIHGTREEMLKYTQGNLADIRQSQHTPLRKIKAAAGTDGERLFNTLFIFQSQPEPESNLNSLYTSIRSKSEVEYPVCVEIEIMHEQLYWRTACKPNALTESETSQLLDKLDKILASVMKEPELSSLELRAGGVSVCNMSSFQQRERNSRIAKGHKPEQPSQELDISPQNEEKVRDVIAEVARLDRDSISTSDNIFNFGLDSISAIKVSNLLRKKGLKITVTQIMKALTVENIARAVDAHTIANGDATAEATNEAIRLALKDLKVAELIQDAGFSHDDIVDALPASSGQQHLLSNWLNNEGSVFYPTFQYIVNGVATIHQLRSGWEKVVQHHQILRTTFVSTGVRSIPILQVIRKKPANSFYEQRETEDSMSFAQPPVSIHAYEDANSIKFDLKIHHALYDAVSLPLLIRDLEALCKEDSLTERPEDQSGYKEFLAMHVATSIRDKRRKFWTGYLENANTIGLKSDQHSLKTRTECYRPHCVQNMDLVISSSNKAGISIQSVVLAVFAQVYGKLIANDGRLFAVQDLIVGIYLANRAGTTKGLEALAMPTLNMVPLRIKTPLTRSVAMIARQIQEDLNEIGSSTNASVSLVEIDDWTGVKVDCFVNFLRLPDASSSQPPVNGNVGTKSPLTIKEVQADETRGNSLLSPPAAKASQNIFQAPVQLRETVVLSSYVPNIDIEAAIRDNCLDMGVFGPTSLINMTRANELIDGICEHFRNGIKLDIAQHG